MVVGTLINGGPQYRFPNTIDVTFIGTSKKVARLPYASTASNTLFVVPIRTLTKKKHTKPQKELHWGSPSPRPPKIETLNP